MLMEVVLGGGHLDSANDWTQTSYKVANRHRGGANILWLDGHVSWHLEAEFRPRFQEWWRNWE